MLVKSTIQVGYCRDGLALLQVGDNEVDEARLTDSERLLIEELAKAKVVEVVLPVLASAPESGTQQIDLASAQLDDDFEPVAQIQTAAAQRAAGRRRK